MMKTTIAAMIVALGVATPANAHHCRNAHRYRQQYYPQYQYDAGPAIARGIFGAVVGPSIPASAGGYATSLWIHPYCNPGFYWTGETCWPYR
jgi:hypothetical protein